MKPPPFDYVAPTSVSDATQALRAHGEDAKVLAGGQSLIPLLSLRLARPTVLVDLNRIPELAGVTVDDAAGTTTIGAMTRHRTLERNADIARTVPLLAAAAPYIGHIAIRSRGTIGGSLSHADPAAELPAIALALDATIVTTAREIAAADFFDGYFTTTLAPDEIVTAVRFPIAPTGTKATVKEVARRHGDFAMVAVAVQVTDRDARIALINVADRPVRAHAAEAALRDGATFDDIADLATRDLDPVSDLHATADYRRTVAKTLVTRALAEVAA